MNATQGVPAPHDPPVPAKVTEDEMLKRLWLHFVSNSWAPIPQVTVAPADLDPSAVNIVPFDGPEGPSTGHDRRIDLLVARRARDQSKAGPVETLAVEVKVTRADFLTDIRNPAKQEPWKRAATRHTYAVPAGLVQASEVPEECGLIWVHEPVQSAYGYLSPAEIKWVKRAPYTPGHRPQLPQRVLIALIYRLAGYEGRTRGWNAVVSGAATEQDLRASLTAATKRAEDLERRLDDAQGKGEAWKKAYTLAAPTGVPCGVCGRPLKPLRANRTGQFGSWRHIAATDDAPCRVSAAAQAEQDAREAYAKADTASRERTLRVRHRWGLDEAVEAEPWRGWLSSPLDPHPAMDATPDA